MHSIREIAERLCELMPRRIDPLFGALPDRPFERSKEADIAASYQLIGWRPSTPIQTGLARTIEWYRGKPDLFGAAEALEAVIGT